MPHSVRRARRVLAIVLFAVALLPRAAVASPLTISYTGNWGFYDPITDTPLLQNTLAPFGVVDGTPFIFSIFVNPLTPDLEPSPYGGQYQNAILATELRVGSLVLRGGSLNVGVYSDPVFGGAMTFTPSCWQCAPDDPQVFEGLDQFGTTYRLTYGYVEFWRDFSTPQSTELIHALRHPSDGRSEGFTPGFLSGQGGLFMGTGQLTLTTPVPEGGTLPASASGLAIGLALLWRGRIRRRLAA